jgi:aldose sugar dehydrogenase
MRFRVLISLALLVGSTPVMFAELKGRDASAIYSELCANCHGRSLRGDSWKHGGDDASLARSIREVGLTDELRG